MSRVKLDEVVSAGAVSFVYCQRDVLHDCDSYRALCKCGVDSGWVSFDSQAARGCTCPVQFVAGTLRKALDERGCWCPTALFNSLTNGVSTESAVLSIADLAEAAHQQRLGGRKHCGSGDCTTCDPMERMVDGRSARECMRLWERNRLDVEDGRLKTMALLTDAQIVAGKAAHQATWQPARSAALRAKVDAARKKERDRVRVDVQDVDW